MENLTKILNTLFRRIPAEEIAEMLLKPSVGRQEQKPARRLFAQYAPYDLAGYSTDELVLIFEHLAQDSSGLILPDADLDELSVLALSTVIRFSDRVLRLMGAVPKCRIEHVENWRRAFLDLGQDVFVCAYLAKVDRASGYERRNLTWPAVIRTDHGGLNALLDRGLAENHQHLYGSSQSFALSWCCMMNFPEDHHRIGTQFDEFLQPQIARKNTINLFSSRKRVEYASFLRARLFQWIKKPEQEVQFEDGLNTVNWNLLRKLRQLYGAGVPQLDGGVQCLDYALEPAVFQAMPDAPYRVLAGERNFLYHCFRMFWDGKMNQKTRMAFYLYLVLKSQFRSEIIQVNRHVGFQNFSDYQNRKTTLFEHHVCYWTELMRMALNAPFTVGSVTSLETRVNPQMTALATCRRIQEADRLKQYADYRCGEDHSGFRSNCMPNADSPFFYVLHYTKKKDLDWSMRDPMAVVYRHQALRRRVRMQSLAMAQALSRSGYLCKRVRGIDCASNEIGCPPEVFAQAYRFMRGYRDVDFQRQTAFTKKETRRLGVTYHAGEDFLDIAGALRAIDEAVTFLQMQRGDRIGHALGLGVPPEIHYKRKGYRIYLPKQERLDDLVWLLFRSRELDVRMDAHLYGCLKKEAETLMIDIYGDAIYNESWNINLTDYYCAMALRADAPGCYREKHYCQNNELTPYEAFAVSTHSEVLTAYRNYAPYSGLYYYYHFDNEVKRRGSQVVSCDVGVEYIQLMRCVQQKLQERLEYLGIVIECNPSSNVLIGTFRTYQAHPIFRFHNGGLVENPRQEEPNLEVCVNTDDLGVFDTSLEFEYAMLFDALNKEKKADGTRKYTQERILCYLEQLRCMGYGAIFPSNQIEGTR